MPSTLRVHRIKFTDKTISFWNEWLISVLFFFETYFDDCRYLHSTHIEICILNRKQYNEQYTFSRFFLYFPPTCQRVSCSFGLVAVPEMVLYFIAIHAQCHQRHYRCCYCCCFSETLRNCRVEILWKSADVEIYSSIGNGLYLLVYCVLFTIHKLINIHKAQIFG